MTNEGIMDFVRGKTADYAAKLTLIKKIREQYDSDESLHFYATVMGDKTSHGGSIHYGIYASDETPMKQASLRSLLHLLENAYEGEGMGFYYLPEKLNVLEIGSGTGFASHLLAEYGHRVTAINICENQNKWNIEGAKQKGLDLDLINIKLVSFEQLDLFPELTNSFDLVISQESICHAHSKEQLMANLFYLLRPGGKLVFSDILLGDGSQSFNDVNAVSGLATAKSMKTMMACAGFHKIIHDDKSSHLKTNFRKMLAQIENNLDESVPRVKEFANSLRKRLQSSAINWGFFWAEKRLQPLAIYVTARIEREWVSTMPCFHIDFNPKDAVLSASALASKYGKYDSIICTIKDKLEGTPCRAKAIATMSTGLDHLSRLDKSIKVCNTPNSIVPPVVDYVIGGMISMSRRMDIAKKEAWSYRTNCHGRSIENSSIGIVGMGKIAQLLVKRLQGGWPGCSIEYHCRSGPKEGVNATFCGNFENMLSKCDILIPLCSLNSSTRCIFDKRRLSAIKPGCVLISAARSECYDFDALKAAVDSGAIARALLDSCPLDHPICESERVCVTPHIGTNTVDSRRSIFMEAISGLAQSL